MTDSKRLGVVTDGAFTAALTVRLDPTCSSEQIHIGDFVIVEGEEYLYFSLVSDIQLRATDPNLLADPPRDASPFVRRALAGTSTYATLQVKPMLSIKKPREGKMIDVLAAPQPVRTIPMHFATLREATSSDFRAVFGEEDKTHFAMGTPLTMDLPISLNMPRLMERSNGVFGQSGTGKSFLARLLLCGIIDRNVGVNLIFDMHNEYAFGRQSEDGKWVKGLRHLFGPKVLVYSLDEKEASAQGRNVDVVLRIGLNQIETEDILLLAEELDLSAASRTTIGLLSDSYEDEWLRKLLDMSSDDIKFFCEERGAHEGATRALQRKLRDVQRRPYVLDEAPFSTIDEMVSALDKGKHVILYFGRYERPIDHMLVANIVTRRVRQLYQEKVARYEQTQQAKDRPRSLMITLEEAHKFLNPTVSRQTIFGQIARELRKYHVTLMVIDQRPSSIDPEVMSQLGTRVTGKLTEERDIDAVLTGVAGRTAMRGMLESLDTRQQILIMGHAVPMPIVLRTRQYDEEFYRSLGKAVDEPLSAKAAADELFGDW
ncbi:MAG TPA: ATP-binding protein [Anaerolineae bacterium]|nr:ATP-binding protein [Anaerolineae bacterium]